MADVLLFPEDDAQEGFVGTLVQRIAGERGVDARVLPRVVIG